MTTKPWGDEPAECEKSYLEKKLLHDRKEYIQIDSYGGFTKLERACIDLKVPDPSLDPKLMELILESRRLDAHGLPVSEEISKAIMSQYFTRMGSPVPSELEKK